MSADLSIAAWRHCVADRLLPSLHGHQANALADFSFAMCSARHCQADRISTHTPGDAAPASQRRRFERFLANDRIYPRQIQRELARSILAPWAGRTLLLLLDETPRANDLRAMCVRVAYLKRALPLAYACYRPHALGRPMPQLIRGLLRQVKSCLPPGCSVVLLADRGLAWPMLVDFCRDAGWHYVFRLQSQTKVRFPDGSERSAADLAPRVGSRWLGEAEVFKKAGWRGANVVATWEPGMKEAWLLLVDEPASLRHCRIYGKRMWTEESFRDDKSSGFCWGESRVDNPRHAARLLLVMALAMLLAASLGSWVLKGGWRRKLDPRNRRRLSVVQMGLRFLGYAITHGLLHLLKLGQIYLYPK